MYSKMASVRMYNTLGLPVGSCITLLSVDPSITSGGTQKFNQRVSDYYFIKSKRVTKDENGTFAVDLNLVSDNYSNNVSDLKNVYENITAG